MTGVRGVTPSAREHRRICRAPASRHVFAIQFPFTNPEVLRRTQQQFGMNLVRGAQNFLEDWERRISRQPPVGAEAFQVGRNVAITPGKVVYRNRLIELIQYAPTTDKVRAEPVLSCPRGS